MKFKMLICAILASISVNSFAINEGVKTISEKVTVTPGFVGGFYSSTEKKTISPKSTMTRVFVLSKSGKVNEFIRVEGNHSIGISNTTSRTQRYSYHYDLKCSDGSARYDRTIDIPALGNFSDSSYSYIAIQKSQPGNYPIDGQTSIDGAETSSAHDSSSLTVYK